MRAIVVGARRRRQGIGGYVARYLVEEGIDVCAVVGSRTETARLARDELFPADDSRCRAYADLDEALCVEAPDVACLCTPYRLHREQLEVIAKYSCHCLCEKPFWWGEHPRPAEESARLIDLFARRHRYLALLTQWPCTLRDFYRLHPPLKHSPIKCFEMHLGPTSRGPEMILDAAPHPLSMLQSLVGCGFVSTPKAKYFDADRGDLRVSFGYVHEKGAIEVRCRFTTSQRPPRPASYAINGSGVVRAVRLPQYDIFFRAENREVRIEDPLRVLVRDFIRDVRSGSRARRQELIESVEALASLYAAAQAAV